MTLENKIKQKLSKADDLLRRPRSKVDMAHHSDNIWAHQNPELYHGLDLSQNLHPRSNTDTTPFFQISPNKITGEKVIVKGPIEHEQHKYWTENKHNIRDLLHPFSHFHHPSFQTTQREAAFYNMMHHIFGLGNYVPKTTVFRHPESGKPMSAQEYVEGHPYMDKSDIKHAENNGSLQKLAIAETVLGHNDRHKANIIINKGQPKLIDNALSFDYSNLYGTHTPAYVKHLLHSPVPESVHHWIRGIKPEHVKEALGYFGAPEQISDAAVNRLKEIQSWSNRVAANKDWAQDLGSGLIIARQHVIPKLGENKDRYKDLIAHGYDSIKHGEPLITEHLNAAPDEQTALIPDRGENDRR
jgi:hypothetical protein